DLVDLPFELGDEPFGRGVVPTVRVVTGDEQVDETAGHAGIRAERPLDVVLAERRPGLAQVPAPGADDGDLARRETREEHEAVEAVGLGLAPPHLSERI